MISYFNSRSNLAEFETANCLTKFRVGESNIKLTLRDNGRQQVEPTAEEKAALEQAAIRKSGQQQWGLLVVGGLFMLIIGNFAPASFMQHFIVFALACFVGYQVIWNVSHALHTPLMAVTNAISGIIILGALLQVGSTSFIVTVLASISVLIATINIVGGFMVTKRMLAMFQKS